MDRARARHRRAPPLLALLCPLLLANVRPVGAVATAVQFATAINVAGRQRTLTQKMSKEFFLVANGYKRDESMTAMASTILLFDVSLRNLVNGSAAEGIPPPPSALVSEELRGLTERWLPFKAVLETNVHLDPIPEEAIAFVHSNNMPLFAQANAAVSALVNAARSAGVATAGLQVDTAGRQRALSQKMSKEVVLVALKVNTAETLNTLRDTMELFTSSHVGLLRGKTFLGLQETKNICVLQQMRVVSDLWNEFRTLVRNVYLDPSTVQQHLPGIAEQSPVLLKEMDRAVGLYVAQPESCPPTVSRLEWEDAAQAMAFTRLMLWQCGRFFLQIAANVQVGSSMTAFQECFAQASGNLRTVIEGSVTDSVIPPVTQDIANAFIASWNRWADFEENARSSISSLPIGRADVDYAVNYAAAAYGKLDVGYELSLTAAAAAEPGLPTEAMATVSKLSVALERLVYEAFLCKASGRPSARIQVEVQIASFVDTQHKLLRGQGSLPRTRDACVIRHMQKVSELWVPVEAAAKLVAAGNSTLSLLEGLASDSLKLYEPLREAIRMYVKGPKPCKLTETVAEWEASITLAGRMLILGQRVLTQLALQRQGANAPWGAARLSAAANELDTAVHNLAQGYHGSGVPSPPSQDIADRVLLLEDLWEPFYKESLQGSRLPTEAESQALMGAINGLVDIYAASALDADPTVHAGRIVTASRQAVDVERLLKTAIEVTPGDVDAREQLAADLAAWETTHQRILDGTPDIPLGQISHLTPTKERPILSQMQALLEAYRKLRPQLAEALSAQLSNHAMVSISAQVVAVSKEADATAALFRHARELADLPVARVLMPMPFTGSRPVGLTMRAAVEVALEIINDQQKILPGAVLEVSFVDEGCDQRKGMRELLQKITMSNASWVGIGGMYCSSVCASTAIVADSVQLPVVGHGCLAPYLSDPASYPGFLRLGTPLLERTVRVVLALKARFGWASVTVLGDGSSNEELEGADLVTELKKGGLPATLITSASSSWEQTLQDAQGLLDRKVRQVMLLGSEHFMRRVVCAVKSVDTPSGMTWIVSSATSSDWIAQDDAKVLAENASCTGAELVRNFQGALLVANTGEQPVGEPAPLDCLGGISAENFTELVRHHLNTYQQGSDSGIGVYNNMIGPAADGTCAFAYMLRHMVDEGHSVPELGKSDQERYQKMLAFLQKELSFQGVSGHVAFESRDRPGDLAVRQIGSNDTVPVVALLRADGGLALDINGGPTAAFWLPHPPGPKDDPFPWFVLPSSFLGLVVLCACVMGVWHGFSQRSRYDPAEAKRHDEESGKGGNSIS